MVADSASLDWQALRKQYLAYFPVRPSTTAALQEAIKSLVALGIDRRTLVEWAVNSGYSPGYVRSLLCRMFRALGLRERGVGAGRKPSREAWDLWAYARRRYADSALKVLRAALRMGEAQRDAGDQSERPFDSRAQPRTGNLGANCGAQLRRRLASRRHIDVRPSPAQTRSHTP